MQAGGGRCAGVKGVQGPFRERQFTGSAHTMVRSRCCSACRLAKLWTAFFEELMRCTRGLSSVDAKTGRAWSTSFWQTHASLVKAAPTMAKTSTAAKP